MKRSKNSSFWQGNIFVVLWQHFILIKNERKSSGIPSTDPIEIPIVVLEVLEGFDVEYLLFDLAHNLKRIELRIKSFPAFLKIL